MTISRGTISVLGMAALQVLAAALIGWMLPHLTNWTQQVRSEIVLGVIIGQTVLAALWTVAMPHERLMRGAAIPTFGCLILLSSFEYYHARDGSDERFLMLLLAICLALAWCQAVVVFSITWLWLGIGLRHGDYANGQGLQRSQFHLWHLLAMMTAVGLLLGIGRVVLQQPLSTTLEVELGWILSMLAVMVTFSVAAGLTATFAVLAPRRPVLLATCGAILVLVLPLLEAALSDWLNFFTSKYHEILLRDGSAFAWLVLSLLVLRLGGWRLGSNAVGGAAKTAD